MARCSASESAGAAGAGSRIVGASGGAGGWLTGSAVERWTPGGVLVDGGTGASARRSMAAVATSIFGAGGWLSGSAVERCTPGGVLVEGGTGASARRNISATAAFVSGTGG